MPGFANPDVERKAIAILKVLKDAPEPLGARVIGRALENEGVYLTERAVRYHLKIMDERGLTRLLGRDGRMLTDMGREELKNALVQDKVGFVISRIERLAFLTSFDPVKKTGQVIINTTFFPENAFKDALQSMKTTFSEGLCVSDLVTVARAGERIGGVMVPEGRVGFATVCSITINGALLKAGVPMDSRFGGILQLKNSVPFRFIEIISYDGSSLDPSEIYIRGRMTSVGQAAATGNGKILANFREIPAVCRDTARGVIDSLRAAGIKGMIVMGNTSEELCELPVALNKVGVVLLGGLNPVAAAAEAGFPCDNTAMSGTIEYDKLVPFRDLAK
ncbi:MAG: DUF128 domain-containing protein [Chloroflexi bacterium]|nr:DUF128 domain-containing protein [Chloroflexota bacterium]